MRGSGHVLRRHRALGTAAGSTCLPRDTAIRSRCSTTTPSPISICSAAALKRSRTCVTTGGSPSCSARSPATRGLLRLSGTGRVVRPDDSEFDSLRMYFGNLHPGLRGGRRGSMWSGSPTPAGTQCPTTSSSTSDRCSTRTTRRRPRKPTFGWSTATSTASTGCPHWTPTIPCRGVSPPERSWWESHWARVRSAKAPHFGTKLGLFVCSPAKWHAATRRPYYAPRSDRCRCGRNGRRRRSAGRSDAHPGPG